MRSGSSSSSESEAFTTPKLDDDAIASIAAAVSSKQAAGSRAAQEHKGGQQAVSTLERCAVFAMTFGPGAAVATYTGLFGWYHQQYHSGEVLVWMRLALFAPFPIMKILQQRYDTYFDDMYTTQTAYLFRIVIMQIVVSILMVIWMRLPLELSAAEKVHPISMFGALLGVCCAPFIGSSIQVGVAIDPSLFVVAQLGNTMGMAVPVFASFALNFSPSSSHFEVCRMLAVPLTICMLTSVWLAVLHFSGAFTHAYGVIRRRSLQGSGVFNRNYSTITQSTQDTENPQCDDERPPPSLDGRPGGSQEIFSVGTSTEASGEQSFPLWVRRWLGMQGFGVCVDFFILTLMGYFGDAHTTHDLAAATLLAATAGRLLSFPWGYLPAFEKGPMHIPATFLFCLRMSLWLAVLLKGCNVFNLSHGSFIALWTLWVLFSMNHNSLVDMTVTKNVSDAQKQVVAQLSVTITYSALFIGLFVASALVLTTDVDKIRVAGGGAT